MKVVISKVHETLFSAEAESLSAPTTDGVVTILGHHEPLVATLKSGTVIVKAKDGVHDFIVEGGILEVSGDQATVLL
jgi:F-type H+-transporting ATPase subunit epsilon